jgi:hypothetical protein
MTTQTINEQLGGLTFAEIDTPLEDTTVTIVDAPDERQDALDTDSAIGVALHAIATMQHDMATLKQSVNEGKQSQRDYMQGIAVGFIAALLFVVLLVGLAVLYGGFR